MTNPNLPGSGGETGDSSVPVAVRRTPDRSSDLRRLFESEQQARRRTERLMRVSSGLVAAVTPDAIAGVVAREATAALGARGTVFALLNDDSSIFEVTTSAGYPEDAMQRWQRFPNAGALPFPHVARTREPLFVQTAADYRELFPSLADAYAEQTLEASAILPLLSGGRVLGAFSLEFTESRLFLEEEREFLVTIASQTALALDRARLFESERRAREAAERAADRTARLQALTAALSGAATPRDVAEAVLDQGMQALGAVAGGVCLVTPNCSEQMLVAMAAPGVPEEHLRSWMTFPLSAPYPVNEAVQRRELIVAESMAEYAARWPGLAAKLDGAGYEAYLAAPLEVGGRAIGCINYNFAQRRQFTRADQEFARSLARLAAQAIERARLYEQERIARAEAEQANRAKSDFLAVMSHELRTPLNAISGYIDLMRAGVHGPLLPAYEAYADRIRAAQKHLLSLIDNVLRFARIEAGQITYTIAELSVGTQVASIVALVEPQITSKDLTLTCQNVEPELGVLADGEKLTQILLNLLSNAIKFTPPGGSVTLSAAADGKHINIQVADTGGGIPEDQLEAIFEPFVQIDNTLTRESEGVGLGLTISRDLARAMGGELTAASASGKGSVFTLILPAA